VADNKAAIESFIARLNAYEFDAAAASLTEDCVHHTVGLGQGRRAGRAEWRSLMDSLRAAFPDRLIRVHEIIAAGERVAVRLTWTGTHLGEFAGITATGRAVEVNGISVFSMRDGRIAEQWIEQDILALHQQLGAAPGRSDNWPGM
jgi:steroid delta-isomerase-like uncharacterized protein